MNAENVENVDALVEWFQNTFPHMVEEMRNSNHHYLDDQGNIVSLNPHHLEGDVWTHLMMVMSCARARAQEFDVSNSAILAALLHDLGKPLARYPVPDKQRVRFSGHEGFSVYLGAEVLEKVDGYNQPNGLKRNILEIVNWHQNLFSEIDSETGQIKSKTIAEYVHQDSQQINDLLNLMTCDGQGRFSSTPHSENDFLMRFFVQFLTEKSWTPKQKDRGRDKDNTITILIGPPGSGKSTWIKNNRTNEAVISRDDIIMELSEDSDYNEAFKNVDHHKVDSILQRRFTDYRKSGKDIIVDTTNMSKKSRRRWLNEVRDWNHRAVVFAPPYSTILERNRNRRGKVIPEHVVHNMMARFHAPTRAEFDQIEWVE